MRRDALSFGNSWQAVAGELGGPLDVEFGDEGGAGGGDEFAQFSAGWHGDEIRECS